MRVTRFHSPMQLNILEELLTNTMSSTKGKLLFKIAKNFKNQNVFIGRNSFGINNVLF